MTAIRRYPHDIEAARAADSARRAQAVRKYPHDIPQYEAEVALMELQEIISIGFPDCYTGLDQDWQADFYSGLASTRALELILADPRFPEIAAALAEGGFDLRADLLAGLAEFSELDL